MMHTTQAGIQFSPAIMMQAEATSSLSATGSMTFPKFEIRLYFRAKNPSRASVIEAALNSRAASIAVRRLGHSRSSTIRGIAMTR